MNAAMRLGVRSDHLANRHLLESHPLEKLRVVRKLRPELRHPDGGNVKLGKKTARCRLVAGEKVDKRLGAFAAGGQCRAGQSEQAEDSAPRQEGRCGVGLRRHLSLSLAKKA